MTLRELLDRTKREWWSRDGEPRDLRLAPGRAHVSSEVSVSQSGNTILFGNIRGKRRFQAVEALRELMEGDR